MLYQFFRYHQHKAIPFISNILAMLRVEVTQREAATTADVRCNKIYGDIKSQVDLTR